MKSGRKRDCEIYYKWYQVQSDNIVTTTTDYFLQLLNPELAYICSVYRIISSLFCLLKKMDY